MSCSLLYRHLQTCFQSHSPESKRFVLALSGGMDSRVLLAVMAEYLRLHPDHQCIAVHVHHGLNRYADEWADKCQVWAQSAGIPYYVERVVLVQDSGDSLEQAARDARYQALAKHMKGGDALLTAQHADDQVETLLLALKRGSGPAGLAAMPTSTPFAKGQHIRPLLQVNRTDIEYYAEQHGLEWVEDDSNQDTRFDRNFLRHQVTPLLAQRWPGLRKAVARSAALCGEQEALLDELLADKLALATAADGSLALSVLKQERLAKALIRQWLQQQGAVMPSCAQLDQVWQSVVLAQQDANPQLNWQQHQIRRYQQRLHLVQQWPDIHQVQLSMSLSAPCKLPQGLGDISLMPSLNGQLRLPQDNEMLSVRFNPEGVNVKPVGRVGKRKLKKLFQEYGVPSWNRRRTPLIYYGDQLVAVAGLFVVDGFEGQECELSWHNKLSN
ncbi:tRNA(Ile)-lysidine synthetase [Photobacterium swingsii]|uniref:tRNA(Ile)-lysidine synthase n=1 Tax=Photobacterium swingsii TaxID=680026 RepID=A0A0J8VA82_9GAMM|nr:tRNA lysidine(34) synthetase TilS [Photobacterium swingsii]KMV29530.1 tRNA(Ile)-lysidine synthetase [Photobacterium swingsii]PSW20961.1 tRNA lysidine(34) synthetase TilS [Photobacterium swingsii]